MARGVELLSFISTPLPLMTVGEKTCGNEYLIEYFIVMCKTIVPGLALVGANPRDPRNPESMTNR